MTPWRTAVAGLALAAAGGAGVSAYLAARGGGDQPLPAREKMLHSFVRGHTPDANLMLAPAPPP